MYYFPLVGSGAITDLRREMVSKDKTIRESHSSVFLCPDSLCLIEPGQELV